MKTHAEEMKFLKDNKHQMFTLEGGWAVGRLLKALRAGVEADIITPDTIVAAVWGGVAKIEKKHGEVNDTEPMYLIWQTAIDLAREFWNEQAAQKIINSI